MVDRREMLANEDIGTLLLKLSLPAAVGMLVQALYNVVDTIFVGRGVGVLAIAGMSVAFPIQMIVMAVAQAIGIGGASIISRSLGSNDMERAEKTMGNIIAMILIVTSAFMAAGLFFLEPILELFGATEAIMPHAVEYMRVILLGTIFFAFSMAINNVVRAEGNAMVAMTTMLISGGLNIILDPIFIFVLGMGIRGAAIATVIAQATTAIYLAYYILSGKSMLKLHASNLKLDGYIIKETFAIGASAFFRQVAGSIIMVILNNTLAIYGGDTSIAVYGVVNRLLTFVLMPLFGISQGFLPVVGFNYGAKNMDRVMQAIRLAILAATIISTSGFLLLFAFPAKLLQIFSDEPGLIEMGVPALRMIVLALPLVGFQIIGSSLYQALGKALPSLFLSMSRQILFLIPLVLILPIFLDLTGVWLAFPVADALSAIVTLILIIGEIKLLKAEYEI